MLLRIAPLVLILAAVGCSAAGESEAPTFNADWIAPVFAPAHLVDATQAAADRIEAASGLVIRVVTEVEPRAIEMVHEAPDGEGKWIGGFRYKRGQATLIVDGDVQPDVLENLLVHEMLHSLGAEHVKQGRDLMSPLIDAEMVLTAADLESLCSVQDCTRFVTE
jgi:hypothetical protein